MEKYLCPWDTPTYYIISENITLYNPLLYYSHVVAIITAVIATFFVVSRRKDLLTYLFASISILFIFWVISDVIQWASNKTYVTRFFWSLSILFELLIYSISYYMTYVFIVGKDLIFRHKLFISITLLPVIIFLPTDLFLPAMDTAYCIAEESRFAIIYTYGFEILYLVGVLILAVKKSSISERRKGEIFCFVAGMITFLISFVSGNIIGSTTDNWALAQFGLFGMPLFIGFITYMIVKYKSFSVKIIGSQALVVALWILIASLMLIKGVREATVALYMVGISLIIAIVFGIFLVKSVSKEVKQREEIEKLANDLQAANEDLKVLDKQKSEFVSLASHQLRGPLTSMKGYISLIQEEEYGKIPTEVKEALGKVQSSTDDLVTLVSDYLDVTRIELGKMKYEFEEIDINELLSKTYDELLPGIESTNLTFNNKINRNSKFIVTGDRSKLKQVIINLIDNSLKYTKEGYVTLSSIREGDKVKITVEDSGVGIPFDSMEGLFEKFIRASNANKQEVKGTGLGLYIARKIIEEHHGRIYAESEGEGKGSKFTIELPLK